MRSVILLSVLFIVDAFEPSFMKQNESAEYVFITMFFAYLVMDLIDLCIKLFKK